MGGIPHVERQRALSRARKGWLEEKNRKMKPGGEKKARSKGCL